MLDEGMRILEEGIVKAKTILIGHSPKTLFSGEDYMKFYKYPSWIFWVSLGFAFSKQLQTRINLLSYPTLSFSRLPFLITSGCFRLILIFSATLYILVRVPGFHPDNHLFLEKNISEGKQNNQPLNGLQFLFFRKSFLCVKYAFENMFSCVWHPSLG